MTPDEWQRIKAVLQTAVEREPRERAAFLEEACAGDAELRRRVEVLLASDESMGEFLSEPLSGLSVDHGSESLVGRRIGPYQLVREIGHGGMGTVYLAERADGQYRRRVAIKLLNSGLGTEVIVRRFRNERQVLAGLDHPNIAKLLDGGATEDGLPYLVIDHVEGERMDTWCNSHELRVRDRLKLFQKVCAALQYAHEKQVIHRDIKPGNIVVTTDGTPKLLDFGIAKMLNPELLAESAETTIGAGPMTPEYASPEQVRGERIGPSSDVYALGVLLYHLLTGQHPYSAQGQDVRRMICDQQPVKPSTAVRRTRSEKASEPVPGDLDNIVLKALHKEPERRYASVHELSEDLDRFLQDLPVQARKEGLVYRGRKFLKRKRALITVAALSAALSIALVAGIDRLYRPAESRVRSIALLPFENLSRDPEQEYFADGITDALISDLARIPAIHVISRTSVMSYKGTRLPLPEIARKLGVNTIAEGSVIRAGNRVRIAVRLVVAPKDRPMWSSSYEGELQDVLRLQNQVAQAIAAEIHVTLTALAQARIARSQRVDLAAYDAYLKGRHQYATEFTDKSLQKAIVWFQQAIALDPNYAPAYAGLADCYSMISNRYYRPTEVMPKAKSAVLKAIEIDDTLGGAHAQLGLIRAVYEYNRAEAEKEFRRAVELEPSNAETHLWYAEHLMAIGKFDGVVAEVERARKLDPVSPGLNGYTGMILYYSHRYDQLIERMERILELHPNYNEPRFYLAEAYEQKGEFAKAAAEIGTPGVVFESSLGTLGHLYAVSGRTAEARDILRRVKELAGRRYMEAYPIAVLCAGLGEQDEAFQWLQKAQQDHSEDLAFVNSDPRLDVLHSDPRWPGILRSVGLAR